MNPGVFAPSQRSQWAECQTISQLMAMPLARPNLISLAAGFVDQQSLPVESTHIALEALYSDPRAARAALQYGTTPGHPPLRDLILRRHAKQDFTELTDDTTIDQVVCASGSNQLLHFVGECLLNPGDIVLCATPTYLVVLGTFLNLGARPIGVDTDDGGILPDALEESFRRLQSSGDLPRVKAVYVVSFFDNPRGMTLDTQRRSQIVELAKRWSGTDKNATRIHVIDDIAYRELRYAGSDVPSLLVFDEEQDTVVVSGTFSKSFSPGIRLGWAILPQHLVQPVCNVKANVDFGSPNFNQHLMTKIIELDLFDSHVTQLRTTYRGKLDSMLSAATDYLSPIPGARWQVPCGGLYVWLQLAEAIDTGPEGSLLDRAMDEGMFYVPGQYFFPPEGNSIQKNTLRLSFGVQNEAKIREGVEALSRALHGVTGGI